MVRLGKILFILILLSACSEKENKEVKNLNEVLPSSTREYNADKQVANRNSDTLQAYRSFFKGLGIQIDTIFGSSETLFPDRFRPDSTIKLAFRSNTDSIFFCRWDFNDSTKLSSAFFNWLDVFGDNKVELIPNAEIKVQQDAFLLFYGDTSLIYIGNDSNIKNWIQVLNGDFIDRNWKCIIAQKRRGKTWWSTYLDKELIKYDENESSR